MDRTRGEGMPVVMEATGDPRAMEQAAALVAAGGRIVILGLVKEGVAVKFQGLDFTRKEMTIVGSRASVNCFPEALRLLADGSITYPQVATEFDLWDAPQVFSDLASDPAKGMDRLHLALPFFRGEFLFSHIPDMLELLQQLRINPE